MTNTSFFCLSNVARTKGSQPKRTQARGQKLSKKDERIGGSFKLSSTLQLKRVSARSQDSDIVADTQASRSGERLGQLSPDFPIRKSVNGRECAVTKLYRFPSYVYQDNQCTPR